MPGICITESDLEEFRKKLVSQSFSESSVNFYTGTIKRLKEFLDKNEYDSWEKAISDYLYHLAEKGVATDSRKKTLSIIRVFGRFKKIDEILEVQVKWGKERRLPYVLTTEQRKKVEMEAEKLAVELGELQLPLAVMFMSRMGLRISEVCSMKRSQINTSEWTLRVKGKGSKDAVLPIPDALKKRIKLYFKYIDKSPEDRMFSYTRITLWRRIKMIGERLNIKMKPHTLRHTFATESLKRGMNLRAVQKALRHSSITTTQIYTHLTVEDLREEFEKAWKEE